jgi:alpha-maltose-1-phosphate synthase
VHAVFRPLFVNEGALGGHVVGHPRVEHGVRSRLRERDDVDPVFVQLGPMGPMARLASRGVPVLGALDADLQRSRWHAAQSVRARRSVRAALARRPADALHVNSHTVGLALGGIMARVPTFLSVDATVRAWEHLGLWRENRAWTDLLLGPSYRAERRAFRQAAGVVAWTAWAAERVREECPEARVHTVHPGVDVRQFSPAPARHRDRHRLLFVGGRFEEKGGSMLLDVLAPRLGIDIDLDVVTNDPVPSRTGVTVHRLEAGAPALVDLFQQAELLCLPTRADAVPFVIVEAMACGVPVVATGVGAIAELLGEGEAGVLVPVDDGRALAAVIDSLLSDPARRAQMAVNGRARCEREYDSRRQTDRLIDLMREAR